jgi:hypothetical protein
MPTPNAFSWGRASALSIFVRSSIKEAVLPRIDDTEEGESAARAREAVGVEML